MKELKWVGALLSWLLHCFICFYLLDFSPGKAEVHVQYMGESLASSICQQFKVFQKTNLIQHILRSKPHSNNYTRGLHSGCKNFKWEHCTRPCDRFEAIPCDHEVKAFVPASNGGTGRGLSGDVSGRGASRKRVLKRKRNHSPSETEAAPRRAADEMLKQTSCALRSPKQQSRPFTFMVQIVYYPLEAGYREERCTGAIWDTWWIVTSGRCAGLAVRYLEKGEKSTHDGGIVILRDNNIFEISKALVNCSETPDPSLYSEFAGNDFSVGFISVKTEMRYSESVGKIEIGTRATCTEASPDGNLFILGHESRIEDWAWNWNVDVDTPTRNELFQSAAGYYTATGDERTPCQEYFELNTDEYSVPYSKETRDCIEDLDIKNDCRNTTCRLGIGHLLIRETGPPNPQYFLCGILSDAQCQLEPKFVDILQVTPYRFEGAR